MPVVPMTAPNEQFRTERRHPVPFTDSLIVELERLIPEHVPPGRVIHDPFGGEGKRLGALCDRLGLTFTGSDLEPWLDGDERTPMTSDLARALTETRSLLERVDPSVPDILENR